MPRNQTWADRPEYQAGAHVPDQQAVTAQVCDSVIVNWPRPNPDAFKSWPMDVRPKKFNIAFVF